PMEPTSRALLEALASSFTAEVGVLSHDGRMLRTVRVASGRERNAREVLAQADRTGPPECDVIMAMERALAAPPPIKLSGHPFVSRDPAKDALEAKRELALLAKWSRPDRLDLLRLGVSIPWDLVRSATISILEDAIAFGLALPAPLLEMALDFELAPDAEGLVQAQISAFRALSESGRGGMDAEAIGSNWQALLDAAATYEAPIDSETHALAHEAIGAMSAGASATIPPPAEVPHDRLGELGIPELVLLLERPDGRRAAALELIQRGDAELLPRVFDALRRMPRADVAALAPALVPLGDTVGDALVEGLAARKTFVRQAAALVLGELRLRRAVVPMVHLLMNEPTDVWREIARLLGDFGKGALRSLGRVAREPKGKEGRIAYAMAHLAVAGHDEALQKLRSQGGILIARIVDEAFSMRDEAEEQARIVRGARPLSPEDGVLGFSQAFYASR
ncbi:MAG: hypothetical protein OEY14_13210, partial [Myxococcales bacterium]|nr:hypothetical protein [Myxococcales bacterium]